MPALADGDPPESGGLNHRARGQPPRPDGLLRTAHDQDVNAKLERHRLYCNAALRPYMPLGQLWIVNVDSHIDRSATLLWSNIPGTSYHLPKAGRSGGGSLLRRWAEIVRPPATAAGLRRGRRWSRAAWDRR